MGGKEIISMYAPESPFKIYDQKTWWSDSWDPTSYGRNYDFSKSFFEQFRELMLEVPWPALINWNAVNSDFCNYSTDNKNCYLVFGGDFNENCAYGTYNINSRDSFDLFSVNKFELSYEGQDSGNCYRTIFAFYSKDCQDSAFIFNTSNSHHCLGCVNLRNASYQIFNEQYSKEEYERLLQEFDLGSYSKLEAFKKKFNEFKLTQPHRFAEAINTVNSTGNNLSNVKNCLRCFDSYRNVEDSRDIFLAVDGVKDAVYCNLIGYGAEQLYESFTTFSGSSRVFLSAVVQSSHDIQYSFNISNGCSNLFGCVGLRSKKYCILNKQYTKEEYEKLVPKIIKQMTVVPYKDRQGRTYKYGEYFPSEISPFAYNETIAQAYFPLTKREAFGAGFRWRDLDSRSYEITTKAESLPDHIKDVKDSVLSEVIECMHNQQCHEQCTKALKIVPIELEFYRKMNLPLPRLCPNCRHYQRLKHRNPLKLWHRQCTCAGEKSDNGIYANQTSHFHGSNHCPNEFETSYAPERPEIVYCESCYQAEVQ